MILFEYNCRARDYWPCQEHGVLLKTLPFYRLSARSGPRNFLMSPIIETVAT
jgi:hypothetical protein